jgi:hypothetical protein
MNPMEEAVSSAHRSERIHMHTTSSKLAFASVVIGVAGAVSAYGSRDVAAARPSDISVAGGTSSLCAVTANIYRASDKPEVAATLRGVGCGTGQVHR